MRRRVECWGIIGEFVWVPCEDYLDFLTEQVTIVRLVQYDEPVTLPRHLAFTERGIDFDSQPYW